MHNHVIVPKTNHKEQFGKNILLASAHLDTLILKIDERVITLHFPLKCKVKHFISNRMLDRYKAIDK